MELYNVEMNLVEILECFHLFLFWSQNIYRPFIMLVYLVESKIIIKNNCFLL